MHCGPARRNLLVTGDKDMTCRTRSPAGRDADSCLRTAEQRNYYELLSRLAARAGSPAGRHLLTWHRCTVTQHPGGPTPRRHTPRRHTTVRSETVFLSGPSCAASLWATLGCAVGAPLPRQQLSGRPRAACRAWHVELAERLAAPTSLLSQRPSHPTDRPDPGRPRPAFLPL